MKIKTAFLTFVLAMALIIPAFAQISSAPDSIPKPERQQQDMLNKMGKPTYDLTSGDLHFVIWITTQEQHKMMMEEMKELGMDKDMGRMKDNKKGMDKEMDMEDMGKKTDSSYLKGNGMDKDMGNMKDDDMGMKKDMHMEMKMDTNSMQVKKMGMDNETKEAMMAGTHHIMIIVKNIASGIETNATSAKVEIVSPTNKNSSVELKMPVMNHFGSGLTLDEKGEYLILVNVLEGAVTETIKLKYTIM